MGFSRKEHWSGLSFPSSGDLSDAGIDTESLRSLVLAGEFFTASAPGSPRKQLLLLCKTVVKMKSPIGYNSVLIKRG